MVGRANAKKWDFMPLPFETKKTFGFKLAVVQFFTIFSGDFTIFST